MSLTINKLAKLSGVSVRTLHWYDKIGLLKPATYQANGYRIYEHEQLLILQQILFFKELGFQLKDIQKLLNDSEFSQSRALKIHKQNIMDNISRLNNLIYTIDNTIYHIESKQAMTENEYYKGFDRNKQKEYEQYLVKSHGSKAERLLEQSQIRTAKWGSEKWAEVKAEGDAIYQALTDCLLNNEPFDGSKTQNIIHRHFVMTNWFYDVTKEVYIGLAQLYVEHPDFKKFFDVYHPNLLDYTKKAMDYFSEHHHFENN